MTETNRRSQPLSKIEPIEKHRKAKAAASTSLDSIEEAIEEYRRGRFVIIVDDEDRENEGDLVIAAPSSSTPSTSTSCSATRAA